MTRFRSALGIYQVSYLKCFGPKVWLVTRCQRTHNRAVHPIESPEFQSSQLIGSLRPQATTETFGNYRQQGKDLKPQFKPRPVNRFQPTPIHDTHPPFRHDGFSHQRLSLVPPHSGRFQCLLRRSARPFHHCHATRFCWRLCELHQPLQDRRVRWQ